METNIKALQIMYEKLSTMYDTLKTENAELRAELERLKVDVNVHPDHRIKDFY